MRRSISTLAALAAVAVVGCTAHHSATVDTAPVPTTSPTAGTPTVCGVLPRRAVQLALGRDAFSVRQFQSLADMAKESVASCRIYPSSSSKTLLLDIDYVVGLTQENDSLVTARQGDPKFPALPADIGRGWSQDPWSADAPSGQATLVRGPDRLQITIQVGPEQRNQGKDVVALLRLLRPYFPS